MCSAYACIVFLTADTQAQCYFSSRSYYTATEQSYAMPIAVERLTRFRFLVRQWARTLARLLRLFRTLALCDALSSQIQFGGRTQAKYKIVQDPAVSRAFYYGTLQYVWWHVKIDGPAFPAMHNVPSARQDLVHKTVGLRRNRPYAQATLCSPVHAYCV